MTGAERQPDPRDCARDIFHEALALPPEARVALLARLADERATVHIEVEALLEAHAAVGSGRFLEPFTEDGERPCGLLPGERVGPFTIKRTLAEGGMGVVYVAEQRRPQRSVALKVIRPGLMTERVVRRFEHEAEMLGRLQHAGIAQVFQAGTSATRLGRVPYLAMELVDGVPVTEHADRRGLDVRQRVTLLARVCDAVHHAHQKGVIHLDLKPANVLVTAAGQPKIIDFGVSRVTAEDRPLTTLGDAMPRLLGTLAYMSPEQCAGDRQGIDVRSDVYSLGVLGYELLTDRLPYDLTGLSLLETARRVAEVPPVRLSTYGRTLRGDMETIIATALEKDPARRYGSALGLAADLRRYLDDEPIVARPVGAVEQLARLARRHAVLVLGTAALVFVLVAAGVVLTLQHVQHTRQLAREETATAIEHRYREQSAKLAESTGLLLQHLFAQGAPANGDEIDHAATWFDAYGSTMASRITIAEAIGLAYANIDRPVEAERYLRESFRTCREERAGDHPAVLRSTDVLAGLYLREQNAGLLRRLLEGAFEDAGSRRGEAVSVSASRGPLLALRLLKLEERYGRLLHLEGRLDEAEQALRQTLADYRAVVDLHRRQSPATYASLADVESYHGFTNTKSSLGLVLRDLGRIAEAESTLRDALDQTRRMNPDHSMEVAFARMELAEVLLDAGGVSEADEHAAAAMESFDRRYGATGTYAMMARNLRGRIHLAAGRPTEAAPLLHETARLAAERRPRHQRTALYESDYGRCLLELERREEGTELLKRGYESLVRLLGVSDFRTLRVAAMLREARAGIPAS